MPARPAVPNTRDNWSRDRVKHYVRLHGWCPACKHRARAVRAVRARNAEPLRYFTLCAAAAVDVFMLDRLDILPRDNATNRLRVYWCESNGREYADIEDQVGGIGFLGKLEDILLFEDDDDTRNYTLDDEPPLEVRRKLILKDRNSRLREAFPFDILNLDFCGQFFPPHSPVSSPMLRSIDRIMEWQAQAGTVTCPAFTLLLTTCVRRDGNPEAMDELTERLRGNLEESGAFKESYSRSFGDLDPRSLRSDSLPTFFALSFPKAIASSALERDWCAVHEDTFLYERRPNQPRKSYWMLSWIAHFERLDKPASRIGRSRFQDQSAQYERAITAIIEKGYVNVREELRTRSVEERTSADLDAVIDHRNRYLAAIRDGSA